MTNPYTLDFVITTSKMVFLPKGKRLEKSDSDYQNTLKD